VLNELFNGDLGCIATWLDIGCGHGEFIFALEKYSSGKVAARGTEPNDRKSASARKRGLDVSYFDVETHAQRYDAISMLNVYSHLPDPPAFLESVKGLLKPNGELILETGDTAGLSSAERTRPLHLPNHLSFASESIVARILERLDFDILSIRKYPVVRSDPLSIVKELVKVVVPRYRSRIRYCLRAGVRRTDMFVRARSRT